VKNLGKRVAHEIRYDCPNFGPPEEALAYFDAYRTQRERLEKEMEFDDIYRILSARNLKILFQDKISLGLMLALAPLLGLTYLAYGSNLFDPVNGDPGRIIIASFMGTLTTALVGAMGGLREIVKEIDIYRRERVVNLRIVPYLLSKAWVGVIVALYQAVVLLICTMLFVNPPLPDGPLPLLVTLFLGTLTGYIIGLTISAAAPNQNSAMLLVIAALVPQFLFGGALLPLDTIPGGEVISRFMPTRWLLEAGVRATGLGHELIADACWALPKAEREKLTEAQKADCACLGANLFTRCRTFPGILSPDFFDASAQRTVAQSQPAEPPQPTALPSPTPLPTLKPWPSPTPLPLPTPWPTLTSPPLPADPSCSAVISSPYRRKGRFTRRPPSRSSKRMQRPAKLRAGIMPAPAKRRARNTPTSARLRETTTRLNARRRVTSMPA